MRWRRRSPRSVCRRLADGESTAEFSFRYSGDRREMVVDAVGSPWSVEDVRGLRGVRWVHVGALASSDFPAETLAELARGRHVLFDGQGLVRPARTGPLQLSLEADLDALRHVSILSSPRRRRASCRRARRGGAALARRARGRRHARVARVRRPRRTEALARARAERSVAPSIQPVPATPSRRRTSWRARPAIAPAAAARSRDRARGRPRSPAASGESLVRTVDGVFEVELDEEEVLGLVDADVGAGAGSRLGLPLVVAAARNGSTVIAVVDPPPAARDLERRRPNVARGRRRPPCGPRGGRSPTTTRTTPSTPPATACTSPKTAAASGARSRPSSPR